MIHQSPHESHKKDVSLSKVANESKSTFHRSKSTGTNTDNDDDHEDEGVKVSLLSNEGKPRRKNRSIRVFCTPRRVISFTYLHRLYHKMRSRVHAPNPSVLILLKKVLAITAFFLLIAVSKQYIDIASFFKSFLTWMQQNPRLGIAVYVIVYALHLVLLFPGTPFVLGAGYVYKTTYGWTLGIILCSFLSLFGSLLGSVGAFLLGRYCIKEWVRSRWSASSSVIHVDSSANASGGSKKTLYLQALDAAISENGFKIMAMLYLTPITPLGPISYLIGTTNMKLSSFAKAKIAALPLTMIYVFLGASTGTLFLNKPNERKTTVAIPGNEINIVDAVDNKEAIINGGVSIQNTATLDSTEEIPISTTMIIVGIIFSVISITFISIRVKKEIDQVCVVVVTL